MIAVMSNGMIYSKAHEAKSPQDIMTRLNRSMYSKTNDWMFTALCLGAIDISSKAFTFANAGFNVPLLKTNGSVAELENDVHMYPLGIIEEAVYQERTIQLHTDDVLVLFSDGIPEARNDTNSFYENETLVKLLKSMETAKLSAREIKDRIVEDVKRFTGSADQQDDITLVVVKLT